jgi:phosphoglucosamine mutase
VKSSAAIQNAVKQAEQRLNGTGRVVLRASGTEPVIRVMVEGREEALVRQLVKELASTVTAAAKA